MIHVLQLDIVACLAADSDAAVPEMHCKKKTHMSIFGAVSVNHSLSLTEFIKQID